MGRLYSNHIENEEGIMELSVLQYLIKTKLLYDIAQDYVRIPNTIDGLENVLEDMERDFWSFSVEDVEEGAIEIDKDNIALVYDITGESRYFELTETETWQKNRQAIVGFLFYKSMLRVSKIIFQKGIDKPFLWCYNRGVKFRKEI